MKPETNLIVKRYEKIMLELTKGSHGNMEFSVSIIILEVVDVTTVSS